MKSKIFVMALALATFQPALANFLADKSQDAMDSTASTGGPAVTAVVSHHHSAPAEDPTQRLASAFAKLKLPGEVKSFSCFRGGLNVRARSECIVHTDKGKVTYGANESDLLIEALYAGKIYPTNVSPVPEAPSIWNFEKVSCSKEHCDLMGKDGRNLALGPQRAEPVDGPEFTRTGKEAKALAAALKEAQVPNGAADINCSGGLNQRANCIYNIQDQVIPVSQAGSKKIIEALRNARVLPNGKTSANPEASSSWFFSEINCAKGDTCSFVTREAGHAPAGAIPLDFLIRETQKRLGTLKEEPKATETQDDQAGPIPLDVLLRETQKRLGTLKEAPKTAPAEDTQAGPIPLDDLIRETKKRLGTDGK